MMGSTYSLTLHTGYPDDFFEEEPPLCLKCHRCGMARDEEQPEGCRDFNCPTEWDMKFSLNKQPNRRDHEPR